MNPVPPSSEGFGFRVRILVPFEVRSIIEVYWTLWGPGALALILKNGFPKREGQLLTQSLGFRVKSLGLFTPAGSLRAFAFRLGRAIASTLDTETQKNLNPLKP